MKETERLLFEISSPGRRGVEPAPSDVPAVDPSQTLGERLLRHCLEGLPEVSEPDVVRHYTRLSQKNFGIDTGFYPLGSCTMKYNPKVNEEVAALPGFSAIHPYQPEETVQGALEILCELEEALTRLSGMAAVTLQPAAGAHGELCGMLMAAAYFRDRGERRTKVIIPDTAHGTNPASCALAGFDVVAVKSGGRGVVTPEAVEAVMDEQTAAVMLTNPNTLGLFERHIKDIAAIVHSRGGLVYCDGANFNALMGLVDLGGLGVDIIQFNLHKTFSTPHGGGGPGSGPVGVSAPLEPYLPTPRLAKGPDGFRFDYDRPRSIGRLKAFYGNFAVMVKALAYIRRLGDDGLRRVSETAILSANYLKERLKKTYHLPYDEPCMHECVFSDKRLTPYGVTTMDVAKRLMDYGFHPPTVYFPLVVQGALMVEPTETESPETLDDFIEAMEAIAAEAEKDPRLLKNAPHTTYVARVDETTAARRPLLSFWEKESRQRKTVESS
ncbi:MAG TPA: glycine dehydrogenase subunit 2 [Deltaproteobacteria bacterium]|nr:glycine dehydrogenase subunit 2 [Deltaproteobacteria bacterium]